MTQVTDDAIAERLYGGSYKTIKRYVDILASRGVEWGLIGPREVDRLWSHPQQCGPGKPDSPRIARR